MNSDLASALRELVHPDRATDARVVEGCDFLYHRVSDEDLIQLARLLVCRRMDAEDALREVLQDPNLLIDQSLYLATIRLRMKAVAYAKELGGEPTTNTALEKKKSEEYKLPQLFSEAENLDDALQECCVSPEQSDPLRDMAFLIEIQKRRLLQQLKEIAKAPTAFLMNKHFNATVESLKTLVKEMAKMQVEFGLRRNVPRQIDLRIQGAFKTFVESVGEEKDAMAELSRNILSLLEEDVIDAEFSERSHE